MNAVAPLTSTLAAAGVAYAPQIVGAAVSHGLDPRLLAAVAAQETGGPDQNGGRNVVGDGGHGRGLFQIDDRYHAFAKTPAAMDPASNATYAAGMLAGLLHRFGGNVREALSAYNSGSPTAAGTPTTWGDGHTLDYADSVLRHYADLGGKAPPLAGSGAPSLHQRRDTTMSFNIGQALTGGLVGLLTGNPVGAGIGALAGGFSNGGSAASSATIDPFALQSALGQQSGCVSNVNTLASLAQSQPQTDKLLASLIDGDSDGDGS